MVKSTKLEVYRMERPKTLWATVTDDTTNIKLTENYRNDRGTYKLNSGLFPTRQPNVSCFIFFAEASQPNIFGITNLQNDYKYELLSN